MVTGQFDPALLAILGQRFETIAREVTTVMLRSARSVMMNTSRDFSTGILTGDNRLLAVAEGLPIHSVNMHLTLAPVLDFFKGDIHPGDIFFNNCPYTGSTHFGDLAIICPVFYEDELMFWVMNRAHQEDLGAPLPTTYLPGPEGADIYREGLQFPCVRVQHKYKEIKDIIRMCTMKIRMPDVWYGDYLAQVGSVRIGERLLVDLCRRYGKETIKQFVGEWFDYSSRKTVEDIRKLPQGTWDGECQLDPKDFAPDGIYIKARVTLEPAEATIVVDLTGSSDQVPAGLNMTHASSYAAAVVPLLIFLDPTIPHNDGLLRHLRVELREGSLAGIPKYPVGTSMATTGPFQTTMHAVMAALRKADVARACGDGSRASIDIGILSGIDDRTGKFYQHQVYYCLGGGPGLLGHDGWGAQFGGLSGLGATRKESVEIHELKFPHLVKKVEVITDSFAPGKWRSGASVGAVVAPRWQPITLVTVGEGRTVPARGADGGRDGLLPSSFLVDAATGQKVRDLEFCGIHEIKVGQAWGYVNNGPGGYGDPLERHPEKVAWDVREGFVSLRSAAQDYGVVLNPGPEMYEVDYAATEQLRTKLRMERV